MGRNSAINAACIDRGGHYTRESLAIEVGQSRKGEDVVNTLNRIAIQRGLPAIIKVENDSEFSPKFPF